MTRIQRLAGKDHGWMVVQESDIAGNYHVVPASVDELRHYAPQDRIQQHSSLEAAREHVRRLIDMHQAAQRAQ